MSMFKNNLAYEASAGSGKTFMLVVRYLSLLFMGAEPSKILALTFTNKAAREMAHRVLETLEELEHREELSEIASITGLDPSDLLKQRAFVLKKFLSSHTKIVTIDSFFTQVLRKFSLYVSLMPDFSTTNSQHEQKLLNRFLKEISVAGERELLINLTLESNKRVSDIFTLLDSFYVKKEEFSHLKFTQKSTLIFEQEAMQALEGLQHIVKSCKEASPSLIKAVKCDSFGELKEKSWLVKESLEYWVFKKCFSLDMNRYLHTIQDAIMNYHKVKEENFFYALTRLVGVYQKAKKALYIEESELSFSDVTALVYAILHNLNDSEFLYFRLDAKIEHILLDEFQDTSILQYKILKPLITEITSGNGICENGSFFFVGDVKQSIYRFRGGVSALFSAVAKENRTQLDKLLINYRSKKELVEFINKVFQNKIKNYTPQLVRDGVAGGYVEVIQNDALFEETLLQVKKFISLGADINSIAILCATNGDGEAIKNILVKEKIDVVTETTTKLIHQRSVKAVLEYLKYLYFRQEIYRLNFFALILQEPKKIEFVDVNHVKLLDIVKKMIKEYKLFKSDFHLMRFLNELAYYSDIEALLFEYERLETPAAATDLSGVRVLTVHKSKGLEYEHVIVMDRLKKAPASRGTIIYEYEGIMLQNLYLRTKGRSEIDPHYKIALEKEESLVREDSLNALYVAFTRAKENLIIIKKSEKSSFDIVKLDVGVWGKLDIIKREEEKKNSLQVLEYTELYYGTQSDILSLESEKDEDLSAINFGLALHYMLEMMGEFEESFIKDAKNMMINKFGLHLSNTEVEDIVLRVRMFIESKDIANVTQGICYREKALRYKNNLRYLDLLVKLEDGNYNIIDYKSSMAYREHHLKQVRYYVKAVKEITGKSVSGFICYLLAGAITLVEV